MKTKILVRGPALSQSGYGEQTRFALRSLRSREDIFDIYLFNVNWGKTGEIFRDNEEREWLDNIIKKTLFYQQQMNNQGYYDISLQVTIPNEWKPMAPINIGYTAGIETTHVAPQWIELGEQMDHIILVSNHAREVYQRTSIDVEEQGGTIIKENVSVTKPMTTVNYPTRVVEPNLRELNLTTDFNFLTFAQWGPRKNLNRTVKCFVEEFLNEDVGLIVKTNIAKNNVIDRYNTKSRLKKILDKFPDTRRCKVYLLHGHMSEEELSGLYQHPKIKAYVSMTHGEGFGLPLFEAAYYGLPIAAPLWSGQCDFLFMPVKNKKGKEKMKPMVAKIDYDLERIPAEAVWDGVLDKNSSWAFPKISSYRNKLREIHKDYNRFKSQANVLKEWLLDNFKAEDKYAEFVKCITDTMESTKEEEGQQVVVL